MSGYKHNTLRREHIRHEVLIVTLPFTELHMQLLDAIIMYCACLLSRDHDLNDLYIRSDGI